MPAPTKQEVQEPTSSLQLEEDENFSEKGAVGCPAQSPHTHAHLHMHLPLGGMSQRAQVGDPGQRLP